MSIVDTHKLPEREPKPGWHGRFFGSESMTFAYYAIDAGASLHEHSHPNEEVWNVLSGELEITIGGDTFRASAGDAAVVPPNSAHSVRALAASTVIVVDQGYRGEIGGGHRAAFSVELSACDGAAITLEIRNNGREQGVLRQIEIELGHSTTLPPPIRTQIPAGSHSEHTPIAGGATLRRDYKTDGNPVSYVRGVILYDDANGERHHTTFCRIPDTNHQLAPPALPGYNYGD